MTQRKKLADYIDLNSAERLPKNGHSPNVFRVKKIRKSDKFWILKEITQDVMHPNTEAQVLVSELYRLWANAEQPKTRLLPDDPDNLSTYYVLSEEVKNYSHFLGHETINAIQEKKTTGLAAIFVISLLVGQADLSVRDTGTNSKGNFVHFDDDNALCLFFNDNSDKLYSFKITSRDLETLPIVQDYVAHAWLDYQIIETMTGDGFIVRYNNESTLATLTHDPDFLREKYLTLFKIISTPDAAIKCMVDAYIKNKTTNKFVYELLCERKKVLEREAFLLQGFRHFLYQEAENKECSDNIKESLMQFKLTGKTMLADLFSDSQNLSLEEACKSKMDSITTPTQLESYLLGLNDLDSNYKRRVLKAVIIDRINGEDTIQGVFDIVSALNQDESETYALLKNRQRNAGFSLWGYRHNSQPVSASFSEILKAAKARMLEIAIVKAERGDTSDLDLLKDRDESYFKFLSKKRYLTLTSKTESEVRLLTAVNTYRN